MHKNRYYAGPVSDHFNGTYFYYDAVPHFHSIYEVLKWKLSSSAVTWPKKYCRQNRYERQHCCADSSTRYKNDEYGVTITAIGHASFLIQTQECTIITDPHFSTHAGPFGKIGPQRVVLPGISIQDLPPIDILFLSHNHYDHMDIASLQKLTDKFQPCVVTPLGNDTIIRQKVKKAEVIALDWGKSILLHKNEIKITLLPSRHWSARGIFDKNHALWGSALFEYKKRQFCCEEEYDGSLLFVGDTGYDAHLATRMQSYMPCRSGKKIDIALLPIGCYAPQWFMHQAHMTPEHAYRLAEALNVSYCVPHHYDVFQLADEPYGEPLSRFIKVAHQTAWCEKENKKLPKIIPLQPGQKKFFPISV